jgi:hypothetical protein
MRCRVSVAINAFALARSQQLRRTWLQQKASVTVVSAGLIGHLFEDRFTARRPLSNDRVSQQRKRMAWPGPYCAEAPET